MPTETKSNRAQPRPKLGIREQHDPDRVGRPVVKRSVSLDADIDEELTARFGRGGKSRFLNSAARDALARMELAELLARYDAEVGEVPEAVRRHVATLPRPR